jgi:hypothetical protein
MLSVEQRRSDTLQLQLDDTQARIHVLEEKTQESEVRLSSANLTIIKQEQELQSMKNR